MINTMIKLEEKQLIDIKRTFNSEESIQRFSICYCKYMGMGHRFYIFCNTCLDEEYLKICDLRLNPVIISEKLNITDFVILVIDFECGGMYTIGK